MATGTVKMFDSKKGYGFIKQSNGGNDVFVHFSNIQSEGYRKLEEGDKVTFEIEKSDRGINAINVRKIS